MITDNNVFNIFYGVILYMVSAIMYNIMCKGYEQNTS